MIYLSFPNAGIALPTGERSIFGYFVDVQQCEFMPWSELLPGIQTLIQRGETNYKTHILTSLKYWEHFIYKGVMSATLKTDVVQVCAGISLDLCLQNMPLTK